MRYGAGRLRWTKNEIQEKTRNFIRGVTLHWIYVSRKRGGRGLMSCENCVVGEKIA